MDNHHHHHRFDMNPLLIGLVGVFAGGVVVAICHCLIVLCNETQSQMLNHDTNVTNTMPQNQTIQVIVQSKEYNQDVCSICLGEFKQEERVRVLPECNHIFHVTCIHKWLQHNPNCPLCRASALQPPPLTANSAAESDRAPAAEIGRASGSGENVE